MNQWTPADEAELRALQERKAAHERTAKAVLEPMVADLLRATGMTAAPFAVVDALSHLTANADAWRDALAPFDSGVRQG